MACHCACDGSAASALRGTEGSTLSGSKCWRQGRQHTEIFCRACGAQSPVRPTKTDSTGYAEHRRPADVHRVAHAVAAASPGRATSARVRGLRGRHRVPARGVRDGDGRAGGGHDARARACQCHVAPRALRDTGTACSSRVSSCLSLSVRAWCGCACVPGDGPRRRCACEFSRTHALRGRRLVRGIGGSRVLLHSFSVRQFLRPREALATFYGDVAWDAAAERMDDDPVQPSRSMCRAARHGPRLDCGSPCALPQPADATTSCLGHHRIPELLP